jgi:hypothetical protein
MAAQALSAVAVVGEDAGGPPDEAYVKFTRELVAALRLRRQVIELMVPYGSGSSALARLLQSFRRMREVAQCPDVRSQRAGAIIYVSRSSCTLPALLRARVLKLSARRLTIVMVALQSRNLSGLKGLVAGLLWPDLLLVGTTVERDFLRRRGARAEIVTGGVDVSRFRPPTHGEKAALRKKWGMPADRRIVLHVGHATSRGSQWWSSSAAGPSLEWPPS